MDGWVCPSSLPSWTHIEDLLDKYTQGIPFVMWTVSTTSSRQHTVKCSAKTHRVPGSSGIPASNEKLVKLKSGIEYEGRTRLLMQVMCRTS